MRRTMLTVFALATSLSVLALLNAGSADPGVSDAGNPDSNSPQSFRQVARFQLTQGHDEDMFMVDTMTGDVYQRTLGGGWQFDGNPLDIRRQRAREQEAQAREQAEKEREQAERVDDGGGKLTLDLPREVVHMTIDQRTAELIPGSQDRILVHIGDITDGRVRVAVISTRGAMLVESTLLWPKQMLRFQVGDEKVYVKLLELKNALVGTDVAEFEISKSKQLLTDEGSSAEKPGRAR